MTPSTPRKQPIPFGKFLLLDRVNIGGMAEVWRGKTFGAGGFERLVAIKRILPNIAEDEEFITMFIDEAKITVQLTHANIAQIFELGQINNSYFIAMEYIPGKDMRAIFDRCRKKGEPAPVPLTCYVISKVCEGLDYAHRKKDGMGRDMNVVHRDVSPQNVLISYEGEVKVIDFGIAKAAGKATKTQAGILKGKFGYMSPEQIRGLPLDRRSDVFAVGVCLYEMLTGERLFVGDSDFSVLEKVRKAEVAPPSTYNRRVPEALEKIVLRALARDTEDRYQYANELGDDLQRFLITSDSIFSRKDLMQYMKSTFAEEVEREKLRLQEYAEIKPPEGMLAAAELGFGLGPMPTVPISPPAVAPALPGGPPVLTPVGPVVAPAAGTEGGVRRSPSLGAMPRLTAAAPMLTNEPDDEDPNQATVLVDRDRYLHELSDLNEPITNPNQTAPESEPQGEAPRAESPAPEPERPSAAPPAPSREPEPAARPAFSPRTSRGSLPAQRPPSELVEQAASTDPATPVPTSRLPLFAGLAGLLVVAAAVGLYLFLREPPSGLLLIEGVPQELEGKVRVNINGEELREPDGRPPREWPLLRKVNAGRAVVMIAADGHETFTETVQVGDGQEVTRLHVKLASAAGTVQLIVVPEPDVAEVRVDGKTVKPAGTGGVYLGEVVSHREHLVEVSLSGHRKFERRLSATETAAPVKLPAKLEPLEYSVEVSSEPSGATILVGGTPIGKTPSTVKLLGSTAELKLEKRCYETAAVPVPYPPEPQSGVAVKGSLVKQPNCR